VLDKIPDENARRYVEAAVRSDTATEPHLTSALNGLKNVLMDDPCYIRLYSIEGGIEKVVEGMVGGLKQTEIVRESRLVAIGRAPNGRYRLRLRNHDRTVACDFDRVVLALPHNCLSQIEFEDLPLRLAVQKHLARYDHPAHYLRVTVVFERPFWRGKVGGSYFLSDAFGGCCVYDEGLRHACEPYGCSAGYSPATPPPRCAIWAIANSSRVRLIPCRNRLPKDASDHFSAPPHCANFCNTGDYSARGRKGVSDKSSRCACLKRF